MADGLLDRLIVSKQVDHLPLYRQETILCRVGWDVTRSTLRDEAMARSRELGGIDRRRLRCVPAAARRRLDLAALGEWQTGRRRALPKSPLMEALTYSWNRRPPLGVYVTDGRGMIDNAPAEQSVRPLAVRRCNRLPLAGDGRLKPTAVPVSVTASIKRRGVNPWAYLKHVPTEVPSRPTGADVTDFLPDAWATPRASGMSVAGEPAPKRQPSRPAMRPLRFSVSCISDDSTVGAAALLLF